ncbi:hypothetical protein EYC84_010992 [Monilinia fructicola]|uniref:Uncharacterized protein n=1 Tax=Monilinia fructicola TaxID=38448 RepID=A0A5M9J8Y5_MONFR|nr:hypothetical protein EYC84_010992 [Monilinia fructicola]
MPVATTISSAPSDLSLDPDQSYDNDQMIMAWIAALVAAGCLLMVQVMCELVEYRRAGNDHDSSWQHRGIVTLSPTLCVYAEQSRFKCMPWLERNFRSHNRNAHHTAGFSRTLGLKPGFLKKQFFFLLIGPEFLCHVTN